MHVQQPLRPGALVQIVDILGDEQQLARPFGIEPRQRLVRGIGLDRRQALPAGHRRMSEPARGPGGKPRACNILDPVALPQSVGAAEGRQAALS